MTPERWTRLKEIFYAVADQPPEGRHAAVLRECQGDTELQQELEQLLAMDEETGSFLEGQPAAVREPAFECGDMLGVGERLDDRYKIVRFLGAGGYGEVYEAEDGLSGTRIALKVIGRQALLGNAAMDQLRQEVGAAHKVTHHNVCRIYDLQRDSDRDLVFLTMELVDGETLLARLKRLGRLDLQEAKLIAGQLCRGIAAAHRSGVLHRDLKSSNVMLMGSGEAVRAVITDFGTALRLGPAEAVASPMGFYGTVAYTAPEQLQGEQHTQASDIYSLGLIFYEMLTGQRPFQSKSQLMEAVARLTNGPAKLENLPSGSSSWGRIIRRCLARDPRKRFASVKDVEAAINRIGKELQIWVGRIAVAAAAALILASGMQIAGFFRSTQPRKVAVLSFQTVNAGSLEQARADGLAASLSDNLSLLEKYQSTFWVVPWSQARQLPSLHNIASPSSALGVDRVITGSLEQHDGKWILRLSLEDGRSRKILATKDLEIQEKAVNERLLSQSASMLNLRVPREVNTKLSQQQTPVPGAQEFYERGRAYLANNNPDAAIDQLEKATGKDPNFAAAYAYLSYAYALNFQKTKDHSFLDKFQQVYSRTLTAGIDWAPRHMGQAVVLKQKGDLTGAIRELEQAQQLEPESEDVRLQLASSYDQNGRMQDAEKLLKEMIQQHPASWLSRVQLGQIYFSHARYDEAERYFREAADLAPDNPMAFTGLGAMKLERGQYSDAIPFLQKSASLKQTAIAYSNLGDAFFYLGRNAESIGAFEKATTLSPYNHLLWRNLGDAYTKDGNKAKAANAYRTAIKELEKDLADRPHDGGVLEGLSLYHAKLGEKGKAQLLLAQAGDTLPKKPQSLFDLTLIYELTGDRDKALVGLQEAVKSGFSKFEIQNATELEQLRKDKRYSKIMDSAKL